MTRLRRQAGLTLIELLISLFIFAILSVLVTQALHHSLFSYQKIKRGSERLLKLNLAEQLMRHDFAKLQARYVTTVTGEKQAAIKETKKPGIELTTASRNNPNNLFARSTLQRVRYTLVKDNLIRTTWPTLDGYFTEKGNQETLLQHIKKFSIRFVGKNGDLKDHWTLSARIGDTHLPRGFVMAITFQDGAIFHGNFSVLFQGGNHT